MDHVEPVLSPLPLLLFATALWLYPTVRLLDNCCERLSPRLSAGDSTEPFSAFEDGKPAIDGLGPHQASLRTGSENLAGDIVRSETPKIETDFVDIELNARTLSASSFVPKSSSSQEVFGREELEQLLMFSDLDPQLSAPQIWIDPSPKSFENHGMDENSEPTCPCTPRMGFADYVSTPDSGYYSQASPRSLFDATPPASCRSGSSNRDSSVDMHNELDEIETESNQRIECMEIQKSSSGSAISLDLLVDCRGIGMSVDHGIAVLDRESGLHVPLSTALSTKEFRKRTGLLLSLYNISEQRKLRVRELIPWDKLGSMKAMISVWDCEHKIFKDLSTVLTTREARSRANLHIGRCSSRFDRAFSPKHSMSWTNLVRFLDLDGFYLERLSDKGVNVPRQVEHGVGELTQLCIRTKVAV
jgi:hypothetical protein